MSRRFSLTGQILLLSALNLALLAVAVVVFARLQLRSGPSSILLAPVNDHMLALAGQVSRELQQTPERDREAMMARLSQRLDATVRLVTPYGRTIAGPPQELPQEVWAKIRFDRDRSPHPKGAPPDGRGPAGPRPEGPKPGGSVRPGDGRLKNAPAPAAVFIAVTNAPTRYWIGARIPVRSPDNSVDEPGLLLVEASSIFNNKLFFDFRILLGVVLAVLLISVLCWAPFLRSLTRSIAEINQATRKIADGQFDVTMPQRRSDEIGNLSEQIARLAARLSHFVTGQKRFLGDISHELCAPISRIQFALGILEERADERQQAYVADLREEVEHMSALVNDLLQFSKAGLRPDDIQLGPIDVTAVVERVIAREGAGREAIEAAVEAGLQVWANETLFFRSISNLVRNALRYAGQAGPIVVTARPDGEFVIVTVADSGPGLPDEVLETVFEPFYRPGTVRARDNGGAGLGLAIVKSGIEACRGAVSCRNRRPSGLEVIIRLPAPA